LGITQAEEAEAELKVAEISEKEIVGRGIIGLFAPLVVRVVATGAYQSDVLMQSSTLALCKFMCISSTFCSKYLPLLFKTLSNAPSDDVTLRANIVIALGDLAFRFPNEFEPYTSHLYGCLRDKSTRVRRHGLMVLTHLILNDMIKCKGQICEIALCICEDKEAPIRDMAKLLFHELSKRSNNPIYNLLPDIISRLSMIGVKKDDFRRIMAFLFNFIKKDKQNETLVEKLCQRFSKCSSISEIGDISYCLAQLKINEKCVKILLDQFKSYKDALFDEDVYKNFASIVTKVKKLPAFESKEVLVEWESRLKEQRCA
jgi:condensin complex subunit 1